MQTFDEKVDAAVHAAFIALGLSVATHMELAYRLNDFITQEFQFVVTDDDVDPDAPDADMPTNAAGGAGGQEND